MSSSRNIFIFLSIYVSVLLAIFALKGMRVPTVNPSLKPEEFTSPAQVNVGPFEISVQIPNTYLTYGEVVSQLHKWNKEAPDITAVGVYGQDRRGEDLHFFRMGTVGKPKVLIHSAIHGNERLSTAATLGIMGKLLHDYKRVPEVTQVLNNRDIYFVPVFSPESYLRSRHIEQGDPNRNWPYPGSRVENTSSPIMAMRSFFLEHKFVAVIDGHTTGRDFFWPSLATGEDRQKYQRLATEMGKLAKYDPAPVAQRPAGYAIDWYYMNGAVAILTEFGAGSHNQPISAIVPETERTYQAYIYFIAHAPEIKLSGTIRPSLESPRPRKVWAAVDYRHLVGE